MGEGGKGSDYSVFFLFMYLFSVNGYKLISIKWFLGVVILGIEDRVLFLISFFFLILVLLFSVPRLPSFFSIISLMRYIRFSFLLSCPVSFFIFLPLFLHPPLSHFIHSFLWPLCVMVCL